MDAGLPSLLPPALAFALALATRNVVLSLAVGVYGGFVVVAGWNPFLGLTALVEEGLFRQLAEPAHAALILLILTIGGFVGLLERSGGMEAFAARVAGWVKGPVGAQLAVWLAGIGIFFSDSATPLILGPVFRPVLHRERVCREKLAYIIDSTASPVCVLVPFISWGVYVTSLIDQSFSRLKIEGDGFATFVQLLAWQYYPLLALLTVLLIVTSGRDFGPMARCQRELLADDEAPAAPASEARLRVIAGPLLVLLGTVATLFTVAYLRHGELAGKSIRTALLLSYLAASLAAMLIARQEKLMSGAEALATFRGGVEKMLLIPLILIFAWSLGHSCQLLGTGRYLARLTQRFLTPTLLPAALFLVGAVISFAMGSAWGTFAILMPIAIAIAHQLGVSLRPPMAAVLSGGLFGDHASPISDTTILASMGAGCRHIDHVRTQLPYAALPALVSVGAFLLTARWESPWVLPLAALALALLVLLATRRARQINR